MGSLSCYHSGMPQVNAAPVTDLSRERRSRTYRAMRWWRGTDGGAALAGAATTGGVRSRRAFLLLVATLVVAGCGLRAPTPWEPGRPQMGVASWYGPGFHGHATTSGEIYDQDDLTAAHPSLPLGTRARVTNLDTGRSVDVRINDRGPFVKGRAIDLSYAAAHALGIVGAGTAPVRIEVIERPRGGYVIVRYCVQVGSFSEEEKATALRANLAPRYGDVYISPVRARADLFYRVRVGPYTERHDAERRALELTSIGIPAIVTEEPE
jgi:rare lipoprotein A